MKGNEWVRKLVLSVALGTMFIAAGIGRSDAAENKQVNLTGTLDVELNEENGTVVSIGLWTDNSYFVIAADAKGKELAKHSGKKVLITGTLKDDGEDSIVFVSTYKILPETQREPAEADVELNLDEDNE